jgi:DNA helicase-2/ATP-dependent DNA helicase PcrA
MLRELGIASKRKGSGSFFDSKEIKVLLDLVALSVNRKDLLSFIHVMEYGSGIGASTAKDLFDASLKLGGGDLISGWLAPDRSKKDLFKKGGEETLFGFVESGKAGDFTHISGAFTDHPLLKHSLLNSDGASYLSYFYEVAKLLDQKLEPSVLISKISESKLYSVITNHLAKQRSLNKNRTIDEVRFEAAKERIATKATTLRELARSYKECERFINAMVLGSSEIVEGSGVHLLSVHASKGLEFEEVFVIDLADGRFPNRKLMKQGGEIEEERRLFYVAVTRAKESLLLSYAEYDKYKKTSYKPSIFLYEAGLVASSS